MFALGENNVMLPCPLLLSHRFPGASLYRDGDYNQGTGFPLQDAGSDALP